LNDEDRGFDAPKDKFNKNRRAPCWPLPCFEYLGPQVLRQNQIALHRQRQSLAQAKQVQTGRNMACSRGLAVS